MSEDSSLKGVGGALFAGVIMIMAGAFWALEGLAGIVKGTFYVRAGHYFITTSASTWGWIHRPGFRYDGVWDGQMASELGECGYSAPYSTSSRGHLTSASIPGLEPDLYPLR